MMLPRSSQKTLEEEIKEKARRDALYIDHLYQELQKLNWGAGPALDLIQSTVRLSR